jgi:hypothetical protein
MAKVDRMVVVSTLMLADSAEAPQWNAANKKTEPFRKARQSTSPPESR